MTLQQILLTLARGAIESAFGAPFDFDRDALIKQFPELGKPGAAFVTLKVDGTSLRGCIGSVKARRALFDDLVANAKGAAFGDPRFAPLSEREYRRCSVEVSLLTVPEKIRYDDVFDLRQKIRRGVDGVILEHAGRSATFLPQVWEELPDFSRFFAQLGLKAGLGVDAIDYHPLIKTYQVESFESAPLEGGE